MESLKNKMYELNKKLDNIEIDTMVYDDFISYGTSDFVYKNKKCVGEILTGKIYERDNTGRILVDIKTGRKKYVGYYKNSKVIEGGDTR